MKPLVGDFHLLDLHTQLFHVHKLLHGRSEEEQIQWLCWYGQVERADPNKLGSAPPSRHFKRYTFYSHWGRKPCQFDFENGKIFLGLG